MEIGFLYYEVIFHRCNCCSDYTFYIGRHLDPVYDVCFGDDSAHIYAELSLKGLICTLSLNNSHSCARYISMPCYNFVKYGLKAYKCPCSCI